MKVFTDLKGQTFFYKNVKQSNQNTTPFFLSKKDIIRNQEGQIIGICSPNNSLPKYKFDSMDGYQLQEDDFHKSTPR